MDNPWKLATLGLIALGITVGTSTLTTAYLMRPPATASEVAEATVAETPAPRPAIVRVAPAPRRNAVARVATPATAGVVPAVVEAPAPPVRASEPMTAPITPAAVRPSADAAPADCNTGGDRALRIAKPGALGAVLGAGLGAAGGAIANGGKGAGKGALIGGLAGAALGTGYGAYTTKNDCGTIFGGDTPKTGGATTAPSGSLTAREEAMAPLQSAPPSPGRMQIYHVR